MADLPEDLPESYVTNKQEKNQERGLEMNVWKIKVKAIRREEWTSINRNING